MAHIVVVDSSPTGLAAFAVARELGHRVTFVRPGDISALRLTSTPEDRVRAALAYVDRVVPVDRLERDLPETLARVHAEEPVDAVLTTSEQAVLPVAAAAESIGVRCTPLRDLRAATLKGCCRDRLRDAGIRSPRHATVTDLGQALTAARTVGFPLVIKPSRGTGKEGAAVLASEGELRSYFEGLGRARPPDQTALDAFVSAELVVEGYLTGVLHSAEIAANGGDLRLLMATRRERAEHNELFEVAAVMPSGLSPEEVREVDAYLRAVFGELRLTTGIFHVEFMMTADGPTLVEINPRMMGGMSPLVFRHVTGVDPFRLLFAEHLGEPSRVPPVPAGSAGIVVALGSVEGGVVPPDVEHRVERVVRDHQPLAASVGLRAGQVVPRLTGNYSVIGYFCLGASGPGDARRRGLSLIADMERALGQRLARFAGPE